MRAEGAVLGNGSGPTIGHGLYDCAGAVRAESVVVVPLAFRARAHQHTRRARALFLRVLALIYRRLVAQYGRSQLIDQRSALACGRRQ